MCKMCEYLIYFVWFYLSQVVFSQTSFLTGFWEPKQSNDPTNPCDVYEADICQTCNNMPESCMPCAEPECQKTCELSFEVQNLYSTETLHVPYRMDVGSGWDELFGPELYFENGVPYFRLVNALYENGEHYLFKHRFSEVDNCLILDFYYIAYPSPGMACLFKLSEEGTLEVDLEKCGTKVGAINMASEENTISYRVINDLTVNLQLLCMACKDQSCMEPLSIVIGKGDNSTKIAVRYALVYYNNEDR